jgi:hypothetical protein
LINSLLDIWFYSFHSNGFHHPDTLSLASAALLVLGVFLALDVFRQSIEVEAVGGTSQTDCSSEVEETEGEMLWDLWVDTMIRRTMLKNSISDY